MQSKSQAKWIRMSPRKVRRVVDQIRGKKAGDAIDILTFMPYKAAKPVWKVLHAAMYNLIHHEKHPITREEADQMVIVEAFADQGPTLPRRFRARARGRAMPILKRTAHITLTISDV